MTYQRILIRLYDNVLTDIRDMGTVSRMKHSRSLGQPEVFNGVQFFAGLPSDDDRAVVSLKIEGYNCGIRGDGGVGDLLNDALLQSKRQIFGLSLEK
jgi:hypothetical protein